MARANGTYPLYREVQRFRQVWVWVLVLIAPVITIYGLVQQVILGKPFGNNPTSDAVLIILTIVIGLGLPALFYVLNLTTEVRDDGLYFRFYPFHLSFQKIAPEDIKKFEVRTYKPIREYGGWGIRYGSKGKAYNVSGNRGLQLELADGKKLLIGSQRPDELAEVLGSSLGKR